MLGGRKFDLRLYVLISSDEPYLVYLNDEGLARFCTQDYEAPSQRNINNPYVHLTNYSLNKMNKDFRLHSETSDIFSEKDDSDKRLFSTVLKQLRAAGWDTDKIRSRIEGLIAKFLQSMYPFLIYNNRVYFHKKPKNRCFQVLGFDILLDETGKPWFLEVNANPSLNIEHELPQEPVSGSSK